MAEPRLRIILEAVDRASGVINNISRQNLSQMRQLGTQLTMVGAIVSGFAYMSERAAITQRVAVGQLDRSLSNLGYTYEQLSPAISAAVDSVSDMSALSRPEITGALTILLNRTGDLTLALRALPAAADLAAGTGTTIKAAADLIADAIGGDAGAIKQLRELGVKIEDIKNPFSLLTAIMERFSGSAKEGKTSVTDLRKEFEELAAKIDDHLQPVLAPLLGAFGDLISKISGYLTEHPAFARAIAEAIVLFGVSAGAGGSLLFAVSSVGLTLMTLAGVGGPIALTILAIMALMAIGTALIIHWDDVKADWANAWQWMEDVTANTVNGMAAMFEALINFVPRGMQEMVNLSIQAMNWLINQMNKIPFVNIPTLGYISIPDMVRLPRWSTYNQAHSASEVYPYGMGVHTGVGGSRSGGPNINININGDVYGMEDFYRKVIDGVRQAVDRGGFESVFGPG